jgi:hypothetical protein
MHVIIKDPATGDVLGTLCVDRASGSCIVLDAELETLGDLAEIARSLKVPSITLVVPKEAISELEAVGWKRDKERVVLTR